MINTCIVIPFYNEADRFNLDTFNIFYSNYPDYFFCLVNDGSTDDTAPMLKNAGTAERVKVINLIKNSGKAEAIRVGIMQASEWKDFEYIAYLDADFSAPLESISYMIEKSPNASFIIGSRLMILGKNIIRNNFRHYTGRIFATLASSTLNLPIYDTQCGAKVFKKELVETAFSEPFFTTWLFDLEIIMRLVKKAGWQNFKETTVEVPLYEWIEHGGSKVKLSYMFRLPFDLLKIRKKYGKAF
ncbi:MAG: glycosyltransferase [Prolixibacteraceae bacterium]|nr:glycosyltransferase [Prolixibacteraceae bacterium]MBN2649234.1 glycosyltransferase [Prolixibacteraceae bacterium]